MKHLKYFVVALVVLLVGMYTLVQTASASNDPMQAGTTEVAFEGAGGQCSDGSTPVPTTWDFTDGDEGWTSSFQSTGFLTSTFVITTSNAPGSAANSPSGGNKWFAADIDGEGAGYFLDQWLTSPAFGVPVGGGADLTFWNLQAFEISDTECWDSGWVEVSNDGGATWDYLENTTNTPFFTVTPPYDFNIHTEFDAEYPQADAYAWCPGTPSPGGEGWGWRDWFQGSLDLSEYEGEVVQVRFHMFVDNLAGAYGWLVDDVSANVCPSTPTAVTMSNFESGSTLPILPVVGMALLGLVAVGVVARRIRR
jgi:hypothetical protein